MIRRGRTGSKSLRPQRRRVFIGCEGASEGSYAALLQTILNERDLPVMLDVAILNPGAGDPHELVKRAAARAEHSAERRGEHAARFILLDMDRHEPETDLGRRTLDLARQHGIGLVWQRPCHEALLLRHLPGCRDRRPPTTLDATNALRRLWPEYVKGMSSRQLASRIDETAVLRVAEIDPGLHAFLVAVGLLKVSETGEGKKT